MKKSAIITFLSVKNEKNQREKYTSEENNSEVSGIQTNDAPVKYLFQQSVECENAVDKIVCIVSEKVYENNSEDSAYCYFQNMVREEITDNVEIVLIPYDFQITASETVKEAATQQGKAMSVYQGISKELAGYAEVYIDYTGGFRDINFLMTVLIRYFEFTDVICKDIVYSNFQEKKIYSLRYIYDMFKLLNAVSRFVETGSGKQLKEIYDLDSIRHEPTKTLVKCIYKFSNVLCLCNVKEVDEVVNEMAAAITTLENEYGSTGDAYVELTDVKDIYVHMFRNLLQVIKKKFYIEGDHVSFTYPKLIKWCIDNELWQQAMTLYVEKMPIYYKEKRLVEEPSEQCVEKLFPKGKRGSWEIKEVYDFYTVLFEAILREDAIYKTIEVFQDKVKEINVKPLEQVQKNCTDEIKEALRRVKDKCKKYDKNINKKWWFCGIEINAKSKHDFLKMILNRQDLAYAFICNETSKVKKFRMSTYRKKVTALKVLSGMEDKDVLLYTTTLSKDQLLEIMRYYLAIKCMRNQINHADESEEDSADDKFLKEYFGENDMAVDIDVENVWKVLSDGLRLTNAELFEERE